MPNKFSFSLATIPTWEICQSSTFQRAHTKVILLMGLFFCIGPFSCIAMFYKSFSLLYFPSPCKHTHIIGLVFIIHLAFDHFVSQLALRGFQSSPTSVGLGHLLVQLLGLFLSSIFIVCQMASQFQASHLGLLPFLFFLARCVRQKCLSYRGTFEV